MNLLLYFQKMDHSNYSEAGPPLELCQTKYTEHTFLLQIVQCTFSQMVLLIKNPNGEMLGSEGFQII